MKTLEELKAALDAAIAALEADKENAELKTALEKAQADYDAKLAEESGDPDESKLDEKTKAYIAKLRKEAAGTRVKNKELVSKFTKSEEQKKAILKAAGIEVETEDPETKIKNLTEENGRKDFHLAVVKSALEHGISKDGLDYYEFLLAKATNELEEGEELSDDKLAEIVAAAKKVGGKNPANTGTGNGAGGGGAPKPGASGQVSLDQFVRMSIVEKDELYRKFPDVYKALVSEARSKKKLV